MIRALLLRNDGGDPPTNRLYRPRSLAWLAQVQLAPAADGTLRRLERLFRAIHAEAQEADADVQTRAAADPIAIALATMVGIGPVRGLAIRAEIGDITRFRRGPQLASYAGLVPAVDWSADRRYTGRITRDGSAWLRYVLVEAATSAMRRPDATGSWARRLAVRKGRNKARVALARVLCDDIVRVWPRSE
jgi:transposase